MTRAIPESIQNTLQVDPNLQDKLCILMDEIYTSPNLWHFVDTVDPTCSFHMQHKEPIKPRDPVPAPILHQQEELNAASNILKALNLIRGLLNQPAAHTIGLSVCLCANFSTFCTWEQPADANLHPDAPSSPLSADNNNTSTHALFYVNGLEAPGGGSATSGRAPVPEFQCNYPPISTYTISTIMHPFSMTPATTLHPFINLVDPGAPQTPPL
ncbi:hypothetical protein C0993_006950 [Termitomyces sp. T159_Od127]|nr:hypothetical protein C0993_006950 [Termitomyces sp. T159_Od127]